MGDNRGKTNVLTEERRLLERDVDIHATTELSLSTLKLAMGDMVADL
jgi:hypothetical protein